MSANGRNQSWFRWIFTPIATMCFLVSALFWANMANPMAGCFENWITVANDTASPVTVLPVGLQGNVYRAVPQFSRKWRSGFLCVPTVFPRRTIPPRSSLTISYDGDDIAASALVVDDGSTPHKQMLKSPEASQDEVWRIRDLTVLKPAGADLLDAESKEDRRWVGLLAKHFLFVVPIVVLVVRKKYRGVSSSNNALYAPGAGAGQ